MRSRPRFSGGKHALTLGTQLFQSDPMRRSAPPGSTFSSTSRLTALLVVLAMALFATGCGGDDQESGDGGAAAEAQAEHQAAREAAEAKTRARNEKVAKRFRERQAASKPTGEEVEAKERTTRFYEILEDEAARENPDRTTIESDSFCDLMSEEAQAQTIYYAEVASGIAKEWDCESAVEHFVIRSKRSGGFDEATKARVLGVNARGDKATATVQFGDGPARSVPLVREDGEWKLGATSLTR